MRIKNLNSNDLFALCSYGFEAPFIELMYRASSIGGVHDDLFKKSFSFRESRFTELRDQFSINDKSYLTSAKNHLFQIDNNLIKFPAKFLAYPTPKSNFRNILIKLSRSVLIKDLLELVKNPGYSNDLLTKLEKSPDWINQVNQAICFHNLIYKKYHHNFCSREDEKLSFVFERSDSNTKVQNKLNNLVNYNAERRNISRVLLDIEFAKDLTLDALYKVKFNSNEKDALVDNLNKFLKVNGIVENNIDFLNTSYPNIYGNLSLFCLFSIVSSPTTKKKLSSLHHAGIRNINSLSLILIWNTLVGKDALRYLKDEESLAPQVKPNYSLENLKDSFDASLYNELKILRKEIAKIYGLPVFFIYSNETAQEISKYKPQSMDELLLINGMGHTKVEKYGEMIINQVIKNLI